MRTLAVTSVHPDIWAFKTESKQRHSEDVCNCFGIVFGRGKAGRDRGL